jgi:ATP-binding cassette subfamily F protein uup
MAPPILKLDDIRLSFGGTPLLDGAELQVEPGDRICLVGRNGSGKSTLLKIAAGLVEPQSGEIFRHPSSTIRYLPQAPDFGDFATVQAYAEAGLGPSDDPHRVSYLLEHLGLEGKPILRRCRAAKPAVQPWPGRLRRNPISCCSTSRPTISTCRPSNGWKKSLSAARSALLVISHDRRFLERVGRVTIWLDRGRSLRLDKGFAHFEAWRDEVLEAEELEQHKLGRAIEREEHWLRYGVTARRKRNMRRLSQLKTMRADHRGHKGPQGRINAQVAEGTGFGQAGDRGGRHFEELWQAEPVVRDFSIRINRGDCIGIVGPNGAGKTTLLKMLIGELRARHRVCAAWVEARHRRARPAPRRARSGRNAGALSDRWPR